jgi:hypothetical protein
VLREGSGLTSLHDALHSMRTTSDEARWLVNPDSPSAVETLGLLEESLQTLPDATRLRVIREVGSGDANHVIATLREVIAYEWLRRLALDPILMPNDFAPLTPDLSLQVDSKVFLADVFVSFNPSRTVWYRSKNSLGTRDAGERAQKIAERLGKKYHKYEDQDAPLVFFVFHGDYIIKARDAEIALYGTSIGDGNLTDRFPWRIQELQPPGGFFLPDEGGFARHDRVSAVVWCDWFATQNKDLPGRRLHSVVYHHWNAATQIAPGTFQPFPELTWHEANESWEPELTAQLNLVARFAAEGKLDVRPYSSDKPW